ncbi:MAG: hypothetical protein WBC36_14255 [Desulfobacterales bacterium]
MISKTTKAMIVLVSRLVAIGLIVSIAGCASVPERHPVPPSLVSLP